MSQHPQGKEIVFFADKNRQQNSGKGRCKSCACGSVCTDFGTMEAEPEPCFGRRDRCRRRLLRQSADPTAGSTTRTCRDAPRTLSSSLPGWALCPSLFSCFPYPSSTSPAFPLPFFTVFFLASTFIIYPSYLSHFIVLLSSLSLLLR